jgi:alkanesulfonate monooxygenase SsuD/methylene tetrahydromethanopterin reductase-like flavin-dependent oxidoreductase (luciferase family)
VVGCLALEVGRTLLSAPLARERMDVGYHNADFRTPDEPGRSMIDATVDRATWLEGEGFSLFTMMDHVWQLPFNGRRDEPFLDCYTALPAIAQETSSMERSALVTCPNYRNPAYLGRVMASLDHIADGRAVLGIGAGWYEDEYEAMGVDFPDISTRNEQMRETIDICQAMWNEESPVSYEGEHYELNEFYCNPKPEEVPILIGGGGEQLTLRATAEYADRWNVPGVDPDTYEHKLESIYGVGSEDESPSRVPTPASP